MPEAIALKLTDLPPNTKKTVTVGDLKILLVRTEDSPAGDPTLFALEAECPHAKAPLEKGAVCNGRLVCPWHTGTFELATGALLEPPPLRDLKRYPVRLSGGDLHVDPTPVVMPKPEPVGQGKHLVFAGAGATTAAALACLRDRGFAGKITVVEPRGDEPIDRTQLTKNALSGKKALNTLPLFDPGEAPGTDTLSPLVIERKHASVSALNRAERALRLDNGEEVAYDALLLATGGRPKRLEVPGAGLSHVFSIRHTDDLRRMEPLLKAGSRVALIGDSFIAFEAGSALRQRGLHTTVLARSHRPFEKKFGTQVAEALLALHRSHGVTIHAGAEVSSITPVGVVLQDGGEIPADLVVIAIGVEPVTGYASDLPRDSEGGFRVGSDLQLAPNLWCAGDIASVNGTRIEHWRLAEQHGRTVAAGMLAYVTGNAVGSSQPFVGVPLFWTTHFEHRLNYAGHADSWDEIETVGDPQALDFLAFYVKDGFVAAVLGCKHDTAVAALMEPLRHPLSLASAMQITAPS